LFCLFNERIISIKIKQTFGNKVMKIINMMILIASLFAIAGAAFFQLFVLLTNSLFAQQAYNRHTSRPG